MLYLHNHPSVLSEPRNPLDDDASGSFSFLNDTISHIVLGYMPFIQQEELALVSSKNKQTLVSYHKAEIGKAIKCLPDDPRTQELLQIIRPTLNSNDLTVLRHSLNRIKFFAINLIHNSYPAPHPLNLTHPPDSFSNVLKIGQVFNLSDLGSDDFDDVIMTEAYDTFVEIINQSADPASTYNYLVEDLIEKGMLDVAYWITVNCRHASLKLAGGILKHYAMEKKIKHLSLVPSDAAIRTIADRYLLQINLAQGQTKKAIKKAQFVKCDSSERTHLHSEIVRTHIYRNQLDEAISYWKNNLSDHVPDDLAVFLISSIARDNLEKGLSLLQKLDLLSDITKGKCLLAILDYYLANNPIQESVTSRIVEMTPIRCIKEAMLAKICLAQGKVDEAVTLVKNIPHFVGNSYNVGLSYDVINKAFGFIVKALLSRDLIHKSLTLYHDPANDPLKSETYIQIASWYLKKGLFDQGFRFINSRTQKDGIYHVAHIKLHIAKVQLDEAIQLFKITHFWDAEIENRASTEIVKAFLERGQRQEAMQFTNSLLNATGRYEARRRLGLTPPPQYGSMQHVLTSLKIKETLKKTAFKIVTKIAKILLALVALSLIAVGLKLAAHKYLKMRNSL